MDAIKRYFDLEGKRTTVRTELLAGLATFLAQMHGHKSAPERGGIRRFRSNGIVRDRIVRTSQGKSRLIPIRLLACQPVGL